MSASREIAIRRNRYFDSVFLMAVARRLGEQPGVTAAAAVMGTSANRQTLVEMGFDERQLSAAGPNDLVVTLEGDSESICSLAGDLEKWLVRPKSELSGELALSIDDALSRQGNSNLAVISVPGEYAAREAGSALDRGLNVFLFSDHVSVEDEIAVKRKARDLGLIVMGPDCGTALIAGTGVGFANAVREGPIGVVASSGTGLQEFSCLVHQAGSGVSHGLGTGSRDLSDDVGGLSTLAAIDALEADSGTKAICIISKPPEERTLASIAKRLGACEKPAAACFLGLPRDPSLNDAHFEIWSTLDDLAAAALRLVHVQSSRVSAWPDAGKLVNQEAHGMAGSQKFVRGLFAGGTFCYQSQQIFREAGIATYSNAPLAGMHKLPAGKKSTEHSLIDMGADEFTVGTPHPMIDASHRVRRIKDETQDATVAVLLLDIILGYNASPDPAGDLAEAIRSAKMDAARGGRFLSVVASICGTDGDPQGLEKQEGILLEAGVVVFPSNVQATRFARDIILQRLAGG